MSFNNLREIYSIANRLGSDLSNEARATGTAGNKVVIVQSDCPDFSNAVCKSIMTAFDRSHHHGEAAAEKHMIAASRGAKPHAMRCILGIVDTPDSTTQNTAGLTLNL